MRHLIPLLALVCPACVPSPDAALSSAKPSSASHRAVLEPVQPIPAVAPVEPRVVALGRRLFHEVKLSRNADTSCASCHDLSAAGIDRRPHELASGAHIDTPTVINAALNPRLFWDGRAHSLEQQIDGPLLSSAEMASSWDLVVARLTIDSTYATEFDALFDDGVSPESVRAALATYERTLLAVDAPFDRFLLGDEAAIDAPARRGYAVFKRYGCVSCHQGANVGGNLFERLGVMQELEVVRTPRPLDEGRYARTRLEEDRRVFRVPSLRLAVRTAPYFHDGSVDTLDEAIELMGVLQLGVEIPQADRRDIASFLQTLPGRLEGRQL